MKIPSKPISGNLFIFARHQIPLTTLKQIGASPSSWSPDVIKGSASEAVSPIQQERTRMKIAGIMVPLFLVLAIPLCGQDPYPKGEVFGGYSFSHHAGESTTNNLNGWGASVSGNFTRYFGATADFSGGYGSEPFVPACTRPVPPGCPTQTQNLGAYHFLAGPRFTLRTHGATPFAHALFGVANLREEKSGTRSEFAMGFGGGVDVHLGKHLAYRLFQADYIPARRPNGVSGWDHDFRLETGIVFTFGRK
jgi:hypothetical protein